MKGLYGSVAALLLGFVLALAGCGGGGGGAGSGGTATASGGGATASGAGGGSVGGGSAAASGGTPFGFETGVGGSGGIIGEIDAFGSIIINGLEMDTDEAEFFVEGASGSVQTDLREGQYVIISGDLNTLDARSVHYRSNLRGPVSAPPLVVDPDTGRYQFTVVGQTVITSPSTRFDGTLAEDVRAGDLLEVSGPVDGNGRILATYVGRIAALDTFKAVGRVSDLDPDARTFVLGGLGVSYTGAAFIRFAEPALREGQLVEVRILPGAFNAPAAAAPFEVERLPGPQLGEGAELEVKGLIDTFTSPTGFTVAGIPVVTNAGTEYENGSADQLGLNIELEVEGRVDASGVLVAEEIEFERTTGIRVEGPVSAVDVTARTVTALGVQLEVRGGTRLEDRRENIDPFTLDDLLPGDVIRARGFLEGGVVVAVEVTRSTPNPGNGRTVLRGPVTGFDKAAGTVIVQNVNVVDGIGATVYEDPDGDAVDRDTFYEVFLPNARGLQVIWNDFGSLADPANRLSLED